MIEKFTMPDGFENAEQGPKRPFIVIDYKDEETPTVLYNGEATSEEEAIEILKSQNIVIDYEKNPKIDIFFEDDPKAA